MQLKIQVMGGKMITRKEAGKHKVTSNTFIIRYAWLWIAIIIGALYSPGINKGLTELDDVIFIFENIDYNKDASNLITSFNRGVFSSDKDTYYRPMLLNTFIINYQINKDHIAGYKLFNILLHLISVILLYYLLIKFKFSSGISFLLAILFAVHPALSQAVAWIPGRNDSLLAVFTFSFMITTMNYISRRKWIDLILGSFFLLIALFTKESALFVAFGVFLILWILGLIKIKEKQNIRLYLSWIIPVIIWFLMRFNTGIQNDAFNIRELIQNFLSRLPVLIQYFGKAILPFNLSVFPMLEDTSYFFGVAAVVVVAALIFFSHKINKRFLIAGFTWFFLMLVPVVVLPGSINEQDFEHRLYIPMFGILLVLSQTILLGKIKNFKGSIPVLAIIILFAIININHQMKFSDPITFWESAVKSSPHSSYATMMLAARIDEKDIQRANELMLKAYSLNPEEKYINYYLGEMYDNKGEPDQAEKYLLKELEISSYYKTYYLLSRIEFDRKNLEKSIEYMEKYLKLTTSDKPAMNNYILMLLETGHEEKARKFINRKREEGVEIPKQLVDKANQNQ